MISNKIPLLRLSIQVFKLQCDIIYMFAEDIQEQGNKLYSLYMIFIQLFCLQFQASPMMM